MQKKITESLKHAIKNQQSRKVATLRLILAALKDREIHQRTKNPQQKIQENEIFDILLKMIKQREEAIQLYEETAQLERANQEKEEIDIIKELLPKQLSQTEIENIINNAITELNASNIRDIGKIMAHLKKNYAGQTDFTKVATQIRNRFQN